MTNPISKLSKKYRLVISIVGALVLLGAIGYGTMLYLNSRYNQKAADEVYTSGCDSNSISILKTAYSKAARNSDQKAKRAEQIGNCSSITNNLDEAEKWYRQAETDYRNNKDTKKADEMKVIANNLSLLKQIPKSIVPENTTEEQRKQGLGIQ